MNKGKFQLGSGRIKAAAPFLALVLTAGSLAGCGSSSSSESAAQSTGSTAMASTTPAIQVSLTDFMIDPAAITATAGQVSFHVKNDGKSTHNLWIRQNGSTVGKTKDLKPGAEEDLSVALKAGTYDAYCQEPGHESLGMKSSLVVS